MTNLVPLHIDKDSGDIVAKPIVVTSGSGGGSSTPTGYLHQQAVASTTWSISHNLATTNIICQVYDLTGELLLPNSLKIVNINTVQISFGVAQDGTAHIMLFTTA